jgi:integrase
MNTPPHGQDEPGSTFRAEATHWLAHHAQVFSPGYRKKAAAIVAELDPTLGELPATSLHPGLLADVQRAALSCGLSWRTVNHKLQVVTAVLNFSVRCRRIPFNPAAGFLKLKGPKRAMQFWERHEAEVFLKHTSRKYPPGSDKRWVYVAYLTALNTAVRAGELLGLQPRDLVAGGELLHVQRQFDRVSRTYREPKGKRSRYVPCNQELRRELEAVIKARGIGHTQPIFCHDPLRPLWHEAFRAKYFDRDVVEAGVRVIRWHDLRHTAATLLLAGGCDIKTVQAICGHEQIETTLLYVHVLGDGIKEVARRFGVTGAPSRGV